LREVGHDLSYDLTSLNFASRTLTLVDSLDRRLEDLPHELVFLALLQCIEELGSIYNVHEVIEVVVLDYLGEAAFTIDVYSQLEEACLMDPALLSVALAV